MARSAAIMNGLPVGVLLILPVTHRVFALVGSDDLLRSAGLRSKRHEIIQGLDSVQVDRNREV